MKTTIKRKGKVIGFVIIERIGKPKHGLMELKRIEVKKRYRRQGMATRLIKIALRKIKFRKLFLTTHISNKAALKLYNKCGFHIEAYLPGHYYEGETEILLSMFREDENGTA